MMLIGTLYVPLRINIHPVVKGVKGLDDFRALIIDAAREIAVEGTKAYFSSRVPGAFPHAVKADQTHECPYCQIAKSLASARMYLQRLPRATGSFRDIYRDLTLDQIDQAINTSRRVPDRNQSVEIYRELRAISYQVGKADAIMLVERLIDEMLDAAEVYNGR